MATFSTWTTELPSSQSDAGQTDDYFREDKRTLEAVIEDEHYFTDGSANSAGVHKLGSARAFVGDDSALSNPEAGRLLLNSDDSQLYGAFDENQWDLLSLQTTDPHTWSGEQTFTGGSTVTGTNLEVTGGANLDVDVVTGCQLRFGPRSGVHAIFESPSSNLIATGANDSLEVGEDLDVNGTISAANLDVSGAFNVNGTLSMNNAVDIVAIRRHTQNASETAVLQGQTALFVFTGNFQSENHFIPSVQIDHAGASNDGEFVVGCYIDDDTNDLIVAVQNNDTTSGTVSGIISVIEIEVE